MSTPDPTDITLWHNNRCSKSRGAQALLAERGITPTVVRYLDEPPDRVEIMRVVGLLGGDPRLLLRTGEPEYAELGLATADDEAVIDALAQHPRLLERPVVIRGDRAVVARPPELLLDLL